MQQGKMRPDGGFSAPTVLSAVFGGRNAFGAGKDLGKIAGVFKAAGGRALAVSFAGEFDSLDDETGKKIFEILKRRKGD